MNITLQSSYLSGKDAILVLDLLARFFQDPDILCMCEAEAYLTLF